MYYVTVNTTSKCRRDATPYILLVISLPKQLSVICLYTIYTRSTLALCFIRASRIGFVGAVSPIVKSLADLGLSRLTQGSVLTIHCWVSEVRTS